MPMTSGFDHVATVTPWSSSSVIPTAWSSRSAAQRGGSHAIDVGSRHDPRETALMNAGQ